MCSIGARGYNGRGMMCSIGARGCNGTGIMCSIGAMGYNGTGIMCSIGLELTANNMSKAARTELGLKEIEVCEIQRIGTRHRSW